jgi:outer membrane lipoprotein-sorting protein
MIHKTFSLAFVLSFGLGFAGGALADSATPPSATPGEAPPVPPSSIPQTAPAQAAPGAQEQPGTAAKAAPAASAAPGQPNGAVASTSANGAPFVPMDPAVAIQKANAYFNSATTMVGDFVQISADRRSEGKIYVQKPGKLRFEYADPASLDIIADGSTVAVIDRKQRSDPEFYFIWQTPLKFLLKDQIDLNKDVSVLDVTSDPDTVTITVEDKQTFGGTSRIKLMFDTAQFQLKQWDVTDPQGNETLVSLFNVDFTDTPDPDLFKITENHMDDTDSRRLNQSN